MKTIKYVDLCSGIGGFRIGIQEFEKSSKYKFKCVYSADIKESAVKTYNVNFKEDNKAIDIYTIEKMPQFDLLCCGFPCQPFSSAGSKNGFKDSRGGMIFKIIELCKKYKPAYLMLENVHNLINLQKGELIKQICDEFEKLGYHVNYIKLNSKDFGVPQNRERVYIIGHIKHKIEFDTLVSIKPIKLKKVIENDKKYTDINIDFANKILDLHKNESVYGHKLQDKRGGLNNIHSWDIGYNGVISVDERKLMNTIMTERRKKHWAVLKKIEWMDGMPLTFAEISTFNKDENVQQMLDNLLDKKYLRLEPPKDLIEGKRVYQKDGLAGYNICKGKLSFPISQILNPNDIAPTLTATDSHKLVVIIDGKFIRKLTDNELKLICGFPASYIIPDDVNKYDLFGNMVTPPVITALLNVIFGN